MIWSQEGRNIGVLSMLIVMGEIGRGIFWVFLVLILVEFEIAMEVVVEVGRRKEREG